MRSMFRPRTPPDPAVLDDHRTLIRSMERRGLIRGGLSLGALTMLTGCDVTRPAAVEAALRAMSEPQRRRAGAALRPEEAGPDLPGVDGAEAATVQRLLRHHGRETGRRGDVAAGARRADRQQGGRGPCRKSPPCRSSEEIIRHVCVEGWDYIGQWSGVPLRAFLERVGADLRAKYVVFQTADDYPSSIDMATALHPQTLLATKYAGETLPAPFGYPLRLRMSTKLGYKNPKWITAIEVTNTYTPGYWEKLGFGWFAGI